MKHLYFLILFTLPFYIIGKDPYPKNPNIDIINYSFELQFNDTNDIIQGNANINLHIKPTEENVRLDLTSKNQEGRGMEVHSVLFNGKEIPYSHINNVLNISVKNISFSISDIISIKYSGVPITGLIIGDNMHGDRTFFSDNWPNKARNWLPLVDHPYDKATSDFIIFAPNHYQVISNGLLVEETNVNKEIKKTHWRQSVPISCWLYAVGVAEFAVDYVDYFVVNVSSPNTPNLRELQKAEPLLKILNKLQQLNSKKIKRKPILLKISPDISFEQLDSVIDTVNKSKIDGIIATNTTISRDNLSYEKNKIDNLGNGGVSGKPLSQKSNEIIRYIRKNTRKGFVIIGVGGILNGDDALEKIRAGADLLQIYTGFIYKGPSLIKNISKKIVDYENN